MDAHTWIETVPPGWRPVLLGLLALVPLAATLEGVVWSLWRGGYDWRGWAVSMADATGRQAVELLHLGWVAPLVLWVHEHRLFTVTLDHPAAWVGLFLGQELCYYAHHRCAHRVRWFWATHSVHHSAATLNLAAALRLGWTGKLSGTALFFLPLVALGWAPQAVLGAFALNLLYQFWLHAPWIPRLGPLEWVLNTPAHHRVHHACNGPYLDCNFGGVLIVFDRLFGTFVAERPDVAPVFGLNPPLHSHNPLRVALHGWLALARDLARVRHWRTGLRVLFGPP